MFRRHTEPGPHVLLELGRHEERTALRDEPDPDPVVEAAAQRLRDHLSSMEPVDSWGRPVPWRQVARIALGDLATSRVRDVLTSEALTAEVTKREVVVPDAEPEAWRTFFDAVEETDRLLGKPTQR